MVIFSKHAQSKVKIINYFSIFFLIFIYFDINELILSKFDIDIKLSV